MKPVGGDKGTPIDHTNQRQPVTHEGDEIPDDVRKIAQKIASEGSKGKEAHESLSNGSINEIAVLNHLAQEIAKGRKPEIIEEPKTHKEISKGNPFSRLPRTDLGIDRMFLGILPIGIFLGLPVVDCRIIITKALSEYKDPLRQGFYQFLALLFWIPGGLSQEETMEIGFTQFALLHDYKDDIIKMCKDPKFDQNQVAQYIAIKTGILLDVHPDPNETIRLIENGLNVALARLNSIPEDPDPVKDKQAILAAFANSFPQQNIKFHEHVEQIRKQSFDEYAVKHPVESKHPQVIEQKAVSFYEPKSEPSLDIREKLARELVAYTKNAPQSAPSNYMSANEFRKHLISKGYILPDVILEKNCDPFIQEAIDMGLLDRYIPNCDDTKDDAQKIVEAEDVAYYFNVLRQDKPESKPLREFRNYLLKEHPHFSSDKIDGVLQQKIRNTNFYPKYLPKYTEKSSIQTILQEEVSAYKLNISDNLEPQAERAALEKHLREKIGILNINGASDSGGESKSISEEDLSKFLDDYFAKYYHYNTNATTESVSSNPENRA